MLDTKILLWVILLYIAGILFMFTVPFAGFLCFIGGLILTSLL